MTTTITTTIIAIYNTTTGSRTYILTSSATTSQRLQISRWHERRSQRDYNEHGALSQNALPLCRRKSPVSASRQSKVGLCNIWTAISIYVPIIYIWFNIYNQINRLLIFQVNQLIFIACFLRIIILQTCRAYNYNYSVTIYTNLYLYTILLNCSFMPLLCNKYCINGKWIIQQYENCYVYQIKSIIDWAKIF